MEQIDVTLAPLAMKSVVPMVVPIEIVGNVCVPLATIESVLMESMELLDGDAPFTITTLSKWLIICNSNGANYARGVNGANDDLLVTMATVLP